MTDDCVSHGALSQINTNLSQEMATSAQLKVLLSFLTNTLQSHNVIAGGSPGQRDCAQHVQQRVVEKFAENYKSTNAMLKKLVAGFAKVSKSSAHHSSSECHADAFRKVRFIMLLLYFV